MKFRPALLLACAIFLAPIVHAGDAKPVVVMETTKGTIEIELYPAESPKSVENFLAYVKAGF